MTRASREQKVLVLIGPTGVGKTAVGHHLARMLNGEIVSADSRLIYRLMNIGTAKPEAQMREEVRYHMIDQCDPDQQYTCKQYEVGARKAVREILARHRLPVVVGGSGLYVRALTDGIFDGPGRDPGIRTRLEREARVKGKSHLWER